MKVLNKIVGAMCALVFAASSAFSAVVLDGVPDGRKHEVKIPGKEMTRIAIDGQKMRGFRYKLEELEVDQDKEAGSVYVQPTVSGKKISVFVVSASGMTHELVLEPVDTLPLESIIIREPAPKGGVKGAGNGKSVEKAGALEVSVKRLVTSMAQEQSLSPDVSFEKLNVQMVLWKESQLVMVGRFTSKSLVGEAFKLMNTSPRLMRVAEQELYKPGVVAVVVESQILRPGEESNVFIVRMNNE